jgi:ribonuclease HII
VTRRTQDHTKARPSTGALSSFEPIGTIEAAARARGHALILGVDEVGRGPLAGPVVACAVLLGPDTPSLAGVTDSKALSAAARESLVPQILGAARAVGLGAASVREIDRLNIYHATTLAMRRAIARVAPPYDLLLIDGRPIASLGLPHQAVVKGDARCVAIACASILAKVTRDRLLAQLHVRYPSYGWARNAGYGTASHLLALAQHGPTAHHRMSFSPLRERTEPDTSELDQRTA